jgi:hypothetical protein
MAEALGELLQRIQDFGVFGLLSELVDFYPSDLAMLVHNEDRAIVDEGYLVLCGRKDAIIRGCFGVRPAVCSEGELKTPKRFLEGDMGENRVGADAHDLGVQGGKPGEVRLDCRQFVLSNRGEVKHVKADHHIFAPTGGKLKLALGGGRRRAEPEIRRFISDRQCHLNLHGQSTITGVRAAQDYSLL